MIIMPMKLIIHQSHVDGNPPEYIVHRTRCITNNVTEKSRHFLDFSTINASSNDLLNLIRARGGAGERGACEEEMTNNIKRSFVFINIFDTSILRLDIYEISRGKKAEGEGGERRHEKNEQIKNKA
jgi:hypothetical protein